MFLKSEVGPSDQMMSSSTSSFLEIILSQWYSKKVLLENLSLDLLSVHMTIVVVAMVCVSAQVSKQVNKFYFAMYKEKIN